MVLFAQYVWSDKSEPITAEYILKFLRLAQSEQRQLQSTVKMKRNALNITATMSLSKYK